MTKRSPHVASPRHFARVRVYFARPTITIAKIRDYSQSMYQSFPAVLIPPRKSPAFANFKEIGKDLKEIQLLGRLLFQWPFFSEGPPRFDLPKVSRLQISLSSLLKSLLKQSHKYTRSNSRGRPILRCRLTLDPYNRASHCWNRMMQ